MYSGAPGHRHVVALTRGAIVRKDGTESGAGIAPAIVGCAGGTSIRCSLVMVASLMRKMRIETKSGVKMSVALLPLAIPNKRTHHIVTNLMAE